MYKLSLSTLLFALLLTELSQAQSVQGVVQNATTSEPLMGAHVYIKELNAGVTTDSLGQFSLSKLTSKELTMRVSALGYSTQQLKLNAAMNQSILTILLEPHHIQLSEFVVSIPVDEEASDLVMLVERMSAQELNRSGHNSLMEAVTQMAEVDQISTGTGIGKPVIRGLTGNRVVTYAQGIRIENQQWGAEHGLGIGSIGIGGVEVIKGPNSLLYGSDAIGGVLFFTDAPYAQVNQVEGQISSMFLSNALGSQNKAAVKVHQGRFKQNIFLGFNSNADYQIPNGDRVVNSRFDEKNIKTSIGFNTDFWITNLRYSFLQNTFGITSDDSLYHQSKDRSQLAPMQTVEDHKLSSENLFFIKESKLELILGWVQNRRKEFESSTDTAMLDMSLETYTYNLRWHWPLANDRHKIIIGAQGMVQNNTNDGLEVLIPDAQTLDNGLYGLWNGQFKKLGLQLGIRFDQRNLVGKETLLEPNEYSPYLKRVFNNVNYSMGMKYGLKQSIWRLNLSSGFRAPNMTELLSDGEHEGTNRYEIGDANLKSENANQVDISYSFVEDHIEITVNPFFNYLRNYIFLDPKDSLIDGSRVYNYAQTDAQLYGGSVAFHVHPHSLDWLHFETSYSNINALDNRGQYLALMPANNIKSMLKVEFKNKRKIQLNEVFLQHLFKFDQAQVAPNETNTGNYQLFNLGCLVNVELRKSQLQLKAGINNLLNVDYIDHLSRLRTFNVPGQGRNYYAGLAIDF